VPVFSCYIPSVDPRNLLESEAAKQLYKTGLFAQPVEHRIVARIGEPPVADLARTIEGVERGIDLPPLRINLGLLVGSGVAELRDKISKCLFGCPRLTEAILDDGRSRKSKTCAGFCAIGVERFRQLAKRIKRIADPGMRNAHLRVERQRFFAGANRCLILPIGIKYGR